MINRIQLISFLFWGGLLLTFFSSLSQNSFVALIGFLLLMSYWFIVAHQLWKSSTYLSLFQVSILLSIVGLLASFLGWLFQIEVLRLLGFLSYGCFLIISLYRCEKEINLFSHPVAVRHLQKGYHLFTKHKLEDAIEKFNKAIELNPTLGLAYGLRGYTKVTMGINVEQALTDINEYINLQPKSEFAYVYRGYYFVEIGQKQKAMADYKYALKLNPKSVSAWIYLGNFYLQDEDYDKSIEAFEKALHINSYYYQVNLYWGAVYVEQQHPEKAIEIFTAGIEKSKRHGQLYGERGYVYLLTGQLAKASEDIEQGIKLDPDNGSLHYYKAMLAFLQEDYIASQILIEKASELTGGKLGIFYGVAVIYHQLNRVAEANQFWEQVVKKDKRYADFAWYKRRGLHQPAIDDHVEQLIRNYNPFQDA